MVISYSRIYSHPSISLYLPYYRPWWEGQILQYLNTLSKTFGLEETSPVARHLTDDAAALSLHELINLGGGTIACSKRETFPIAVQLRNKMFQSGFIKGNLRVSLQSCLRGRDKWVTVYQYGVWLWKSTLLSLWITSGVGGGKRITACISRFSYAYLQATEIAGRSDSFPPSPFPGKESKI